VEEAYRECRFFGSYSGVSLPLNLVNSIAAEALSNRNTFIRGYFDEAGRLRKFEKIVYGEVELTHRYEYHSNGSLRRAEIVMMDEDAVIRCFDEKGAQTGSNDIMLCKSKFMPARGSSRCAAPNGIVAFPTAC
jgi:Family of unknown function (DUF6156)